MGALANKIEENVHFSIDILTRWFIIECNKVWKLTYKLIGWSTLRKQKLNKLF